MAASRGLEVVLAHTIIIRSAASGIPVPVAAAEDVVHGNVWAFQDPARRASKRQKGLADIARLRRPSPLCARTSSTTT
jgi:hypothetical protein